MITVINTSISESRSVARIWMEGQKLAHAGVEIGKRYIVKINEEDHQIELRPAPEDFEGRTISVSKRTRNSKQLPLIELRDEILDKVFGIGQKVRIAIRNARIVVTLCHIAKRVKERVMRFNNKISKGQPLETISCFHGGGVLDSAIHSGLEMAGVKSFVKVAVELEGKYLDSSLSNNPQLWSDESIVINSDIRDLNVLGDNFPKADLFVAGVPCTGASVSGLAKNKLAFAEEHSTAGSLFVDVLAFVKAMNPSIVVLENVREYINTASMTVIRSVLTHMGYELSMTILSGNELGCLEDRKRMCLVATTPGACEKIDFDQLRPVREKELTLSEILEVVPESSDRWKKLEYLAKKEIRDKAAGKGFARQLLTGEEEKCGVSGRGYAKIRSTEPQIISPFDAEKSRIFTPVEHARVKGIPEHMIEGLSDTTAHEVLGQSVCYPAFQSVGLLIGETIHRVKNGIKAVAQSAKRNTVTSIVKPLVETGNMSQSCMFA